MNRERQVSKNHSKIEGTKFCWSFLYSFLRDSDFFMEFKVVLRVIKRTDNKFREAKNNMALRRQSICVLDVMISYKKSIAMHLGSNSSIEATLKLADISSVLAIAAEKFCLLTDRQKINEIIHEYYPSVFKSE